MASNIKGINVSIGGDTVGLQSALSDVNKKINTTQSELRQVERGLKLDPNNVVLLKQKQDLLSQSIQKTKEKLKSLEDVQEDVTKQFKSGEIGEDAYRAFQREVENTKSKLKSLEAEKKSVTAVADEFKSAKINTEAVKVAVSKVGTALKSAAVSAGKFGASAGKMGVKTIKASVEGATKALEVYTAALASSATAAVGLAVNAGAAADDINTMAAQTGLSTEQIQKFQYASDIIDVDIETLTGSMAKLTKNMGNAQGGTGKAAEAFDALGISITGNDGNLRNNQDVFNESIIALGKMENATQRDAYAMQMFGKSAQDLNPLILGSAEDLALLGDSADKAGMILSDTALNDLNVFNDSVDILKANTAASGKVLAGPFADAFTDVADLLGESIPTLSKSLANIFSGDDVEKNVEIFTSTLSTMLLSIVKNIEKLLPKFITGFNSIVISIANAVIAALPTVITGILPTLIEGLTGLTIEIVNLLPTLLPMLVEGAIALFLGLLDGLNQVIDTLMPLLPEIIANISQVLVDNMSTIITAGFDLLIGLITGITNCVPELIQAVIALIPEITQALTDNLPALITAGIDLVVALATGLPQAIPTIIEAIPQIIMAIVEGFQEQDWLQIGIDIISGIGTGLFEGVESIGKEIGKVGTKIKDGFKDFFGIHSPSRIFRDEIGLNLARGIGVGFEDEIEDVNEQMQAAMPITFDTDVNMHSKNGNSNSSQALNSAVPSQAVFNLIVDGKEMSTHLAPFLDVINGANIKLALRGWA